MTKRTGLRNKITHAYLLQAVLILVAAIVGVYLAKIAIEEILIKNAIQEEQDFFWQNYRLSEDFTLPHTKNLTGYFNRQDLPEYIQQALPDRLGFFEIGQGEGRVVVQVSQQAQQTLYLVYYRGQVDALIVYYGLAPLLVVLVILYLSLWAAYRFNRRTISPFLDLAHKIDKIDLSNPDFSTLKLDSPPFDAENEIQVLSDATIGLGERLLSFIERERNFTRDASHELRTPLTVINIAADMLLVEQALPDATKKSVIKIQNAASDIAQLIEVFLLLAREDDQALTRESVSISKVVSSEIDACRELLETRNLEIKFSPEHDLKLWTSSVVVSIILRNLIRNAVIYTHEGSIRIKVENKSVIVEDSGSGIKDEDIESIFEPYQRMDNQRASGFGIGLTIVKRLSNRFDWPIDVKSEIGQGTRFEVFFPDAALEGINPQPKNSLVL